MIDLLRHILDVTKEVQQLAFDHLPPGALHSEFEGTNPTEHLIDIPALNLPCPRSLVPHLLELGVPQPVASQLSNAFTDAALKLRCDNDKGYRGVCRFIIGNQRPNASTSTRLRHACSIYQTFYSKQLESWDANVLQVAKSKIARFTTPDTGSSSSTEGQGCEQTVKKPFNHNYVPLLEHFFSENAFPTHADKAFLARKSGMSYHQIHVWFQNHRSRARKEGRPLKKKPMREAPKSSFDDLIKKMGDRIIPEEQREEYVDSDASEYEWQYDSSDVESSVRSLSMRPLDVFDILDIPAPPHAFPASYPPPCDLNPFPIKAGIRNFPAPVWRRLPAHTPVKYTPVDLDEVTEAFKNLVVRDGSRKRWVKKQRPDPRNRSKPKRTSPPPPKPDQSAATAAITTKLPSAPLHAFIPPVLVTPPSPFHLSQIPSIPAPPSRRHVFKSPSPQSKPATLVPPISPTPDSRKCPARSRKVAPLPKRMPRGTSIAHRGVTPAASEASISSPSPSSSHSRTPSLESESSPSRLFSDSSSMSSEVVTPESSIIALPGSTPAPSLSLPGFDFSSPSNMSELFGDCPSPVEGLQHSLQSQHGPGGKKTPALDFTFGRPVPFSFGQTRS